MEAREMIRAAQRIIRGSKSFTFDDENILEITGYYSGTKVAIDLDSLLDLLDEKVTDLDWDENDVGDYISIEE